MRPQKLRLIAAKPACRRFSPDTGNDAPAMTLGLDMLEALRLADAEGLSQEEAARQMEISPPTFCRLLAEARRRVAQALTRGLPLVMEGGPVRLRCQHHSGGEGPHGGHGQLRMGRRGRPGQQSRQRSRVLLPVRVAGTASGMAGEAGHHADFRSDDAHRRRRHDAVQGRRKGATDMLWTKLGMGLLGMAGKGLAGSGLLQTLSQGLGSGKGGGSGKGMGCGRGGSLHGSGMKGSRSGKDGKGCRQTDAPALDELLTGLLQRQTTVGETVRTFLPAASPHEAGAETIDVQALPAGAAASTAVDNTDMEAAMRALLGSIHHFSDGRVRLRHPLFRESSTFGALHTLLCEGTGIRDATFNAATGSALLTYDPGQTSRKEFLQQALPLGACLLEWEARHS